MGLDARSSSPAAAGTSLKERHGPTARVVRRGMPRPHPEPPHLRLAAGLSRAVKDIPEKADYARTRPARSHGCELRRSRIRELLVILASYLRRHRADLACAVGGGLGLSSRNARQRNGQLLRSLLAAAYERKTCHLPSDLADSLWKRFTEVCPA